MANFKLREKEILAWFNAGRSYAEVPDWVREKINFQEYCEIPTGYWVYKDDHGVGIMPAERFNRLYERIIP